MKLAVDFSQKNLMFVDNVFLTLSLPIPFDLLYYSFLMFVDFNDYAEISDEEDDQVDYADPGICLNIFQNRLYFQCHPALLRMVNI